MTPQEEKVYIIATALLNIDVMPTPTVLNRALGRRGRVNMNMINGRETRARRRALEDAGWTYDDSCHRWRAASAD